MPGRFSSGAGRVAVGGILAAGSLAVLWLASVTPTGQLGVTAVAGLFPVGAVLAAGRTAGYLCWAAASILGLLLLPDKGAAPVCRAAASPRPTFVGAHSMRPRAADSRPYGDSWSKKSNSSCGTSAMAPSRVTA